MTRTGTFIWTILLLLSLFTNFWLTSGEESAIENDDNDNNDHLIYLKEATFDPLVESPKLPLNLIYNNSNRYFLVQCIGPIQPTWSHNLVNSGATILGYIPNFTYLVHLEAGSKENVEQLPFVRWVGVYQPAYKLDHKLLAEQGLVQINVIFFNENQDFKNLLLVRDKIESIGGKILKIEPDVNNMIIEVESTDLLELVFVPEVEWIDLYSPPKPLMDNIRVFTGAESPLHDHGFNGSGIVGEVKDSGLDIEHLEFQDQLIGTDGNFDEDTHGTSTFGIVFARGANERAKGMLPGGKGVFASWGVGRKQSIANLVTRWDGVFQSNSWSAGAADSSYASNTRQNDDAVFTYDVSMLYATGNGGGEGTISQEATAKNVIGVGAFNHYNNKDRTDDRHTGNQGNRGPTDDGRVKPDVVGPYDSIYTTTTNDRYTSSFGGTSGATPVAAGAVGLIYEMYKENHFDNNPIGAMPHASTVKALLIADAYQYEFSQGNRMAQGWGLVDVGNIYNIGVNHLIDDEQSVLKTGRTNSYKINPTTATPLKISLVWTDVPGTTSAARHLINDLNLKVTDPDGNIYYGNYGLDISKWSQNGGEPDYINNVENVFIENPKTGAWTIEVSGYNIPMDGNRDTPEIDQSYALVASGVTKYDHDLRVNTIEFPKFVATDENVFVNATVMNIGTNIETNVKIELQINNISVDTDYLDRIGVGESSDVYLNWIPKEPGKYFISALIEPLDGEFSVWDNRRDDYITVNIVAGNVLVDDGHGNDQNFQYYYQYLETMSNDKYRIYYTKKLITTELLSKFDVFITAWPTETFSSAEISSLEDFVYNGGGLLVIGEDDPDICSELTGFSGIHWGAPYRLQYAGETNEINAHEITEDVDTLYFDSPRLPLEISPPAEEVVYTYGGILYDRVTVAAAEYGSGKLVAIADADCLNSLFIERADNLAFGENILTWLNNGRPVSIITSPLNNSKYQSTDKINFDGSASYDPDSDVLKYLWRSSISGELGTTESFSGELEPGMHIITLEVSDSAGKRGISEIILRVLTPPTVEIHYPTQNTLVSGIIEISGSAKDIDGAVQRVEIMLDGSFWQNAVDISTNTPWSNWTFTWDSKNVTDGFHRISVRSIDNESLNSSIVNIDVMIDNTPPRLIEGPDIKDISSSGVTIEWRTNELSTSLVEYGLDLAYENSLSNDSLVKQHRIELTGLQAKTVYYFRIISSDTVGNALKVTDYYDLTFETAPPPDYEPPIVNIKSPQTKETLSGEVLIQIEVSDNQGISLVEFYIDNILMFTDDTPEYYWLWDTSVGDYPDGQYTIKIIAKDLSGNDASDEIIINLDNIIIDPSIESFNVSPTTVVSGETTEVLITLEITDPENRLEYVTVDLQSIGGSPRQIMYDDGTHGDQESGDLIFSFMATVDSDTAPGEKVMVSKLTHSNGATLEVEAILFMNSPPPKKMTEIILDDTQLFFGIYILIIISIIAVGLGLSVMLRARNKHKRSLEAVEVVPIFEYK